MKKISKIYNNSLIRYMFFSGAMIVITPFLWAFGDFGIFYTFVIVTILKFILDTNYVFHFKFHSKKLMLKSFLKFVIIYFISGLIVWILIPIFDAFPIDNFKYVGGLLGFIIAFIPRYILEKKYVFTHQSH